MAVSVQGQIMTWETALGGNGNTYQVVRGVYDWDTASALAASAGGHLATITSGAENLFITSLVESDPDTIVLDLWIGGLQPVGSAEPAGGWSWMTGEPFNFSNWAPGTPDDFGVGEDRIDIVRANYGLNANGVFWDDVHSSSGIAGYVVEFEATPVPEPTECAGLASLALIGFWAWRRSR